MIDCSHANSGKDFSRQPAIFMDIVKQIKAGNRGICGVMLESYLFEGNQPYASHGLQKGVSITDSCISFETTEKIVHEAYRLLR